MEEYIGASLMVKTNRATYVGVLQNIEPGQRRLVVDVLGRPQMIDVVDIDEIEILAEEESQIIQSRTEQQPQPREEEEKLQIDAVNERKNEKDAKTQGSSVFVTPQEYEEILKLSDAVYGPSHSEVVYSGSRGVLHLFVNIYKVMDRKFVIFTGTGVFSEIGISLARLFLLYNAKVTVVPAGKSANTQTEMFYYENNGGIVGTKRTNQTIVVIADVEATEEMVKDAEKVVFLGDYQSIEHPSKEVIFFGAAIRDPGMFSGSSILCDIGLSMQIYKNYNLKRYSPKLLQKIAK